MEPVTVQRMLKQRKKLLIIDVRSALEYRSGHIQGAVNIPFWKVGAHKSMFAENDKVILLCCEHGPRAWLAGGMLKLIGIGRIEYVSGHMQRWKIERLPLQKP